MLLVLLLEQITYPNATPKLPVTRLLARFFTSGDSKLDAEWDAIYKEMKQHGGRIQFRGLIDMESRMDSLDSLSKKIGKLSSIPDAKIRESNVKNTQ